jgi:hypothetical protein
MARGIHGLPKVSPGPAMPDPSMPCKWATPKTALRPYAGRWPAAVFYPLGYPTLCRPAWVPLEETLQKPATRWTY